MRLLTLLLCCALCGCATIHRHPILTGAVLGGVTAGVIVAVRHHSCASSYDHVPYQGTPPCPTWCAPGGKCYWP